MAPGPTEPGPVADDLAIRTLLADALDAVARGDATAWGACWTDDGVWVVPGFGALVGADAVARFAEQRGAYALCVQSLLSGRADVEGDTGTGRWYFREIQRGADGAGSELYGCYDDEYRRTGAGWRFSRRRFWILYRGPLALPGTTYRPPPPRA